MIIKFFQLLFQSKKENLIEVDDNLLLVPELPFYGIAGTICRIEEAPEAYYKVLYNQDGTINPLKIPVPKKKKRNLSLLLGDYINDVKKYLEVYQDKYIDYSDKKVKPILNKREFYILLVITILATMASIPFLFTTVVVGLFFSTVSTLSLYVVIDIHKKDREKDDNNKNFVAKYRVLEKLLSDYQDGKSIIKLNKQNVSFNKGVNDSTKVSVFDKILISDNYREVA